jgi:hypothetical protein
MKRAKRALVVVAAWLLIGGCTANAAGRTNVQNATGESVDVVVKFSDGSTPLRYQLNNQELGAVGSTPPCRAVTIKAASAASAKTWKLDAELCDDQVVVIETDGIRVDDR